MTFEDLPDDWSDRPLTDPALVTDVLDLVVMDRDRRRGSLCLLLCDDEARLLQPVAISELEAIASEHERARGLTTLLGVLGGHGAVLVALARPDGLSIREDDVRWRDACARVCSAVGVRLLGVHVVTCDGSREVPVDLAAALHVACPPAAVDRSCSGGREGLRPGGPVRVAGGRHTA